MDTLEKLVVTLQSDCTCSNEDETPASDCFGCWDDSVEYFKEVISTWRERAGIDADLVSIEGRGMTWQSLSGHAITNLDTLYKALTINGDFRLTFTLEGETLTATRHSHDEPMGCSFAFTPHTEEDED